MLFRIFSPFIIYSICVLPAVAQDYVVTLKGDTLRGKVKLQNSQVEKRVSVAEAGKKSATFSIMQTKSVQLQGERYDPVRYGDIYVFMKLKKAGYLSLYAFQMERQTNYDGNYLLKKDGQGMEVPNLVFKKNMIKFLSECPSVTKRIDDGELGRKDLDEVINAFNNCIEANSVISKTPVVTQPTTATANLTEWQMLESKVKDSSLENKNDALDMIVEIKNKLSKGEKVPKFIIDGLRTMLQPSQELTALFEENIKEL